MNPKQINKQIEIIHKLFPSNKSELNWKTDFQLLMAVMLSAQTTDKQVNKTTDKFFGKIKKPQDVLDRGLEELQNAIRSIGLYNSKAKNIYNTSKILVENCDSRISDDFQELIKLPGVGEKTAKVVLYNLHGQKRVAVDTHIHRVANRLGRVETKSPLQTSKLLEIYISDENKINAHQCLVLFGRYHCTARKPKCTECPFVKVCKYYKTAK